MNAASFRVTLVDDHPLFAEALAIALRSRGVDTSTVIPDPYTSTFGQLAREIGRTKPGLVLLDLDLGVMGDQMGLISSLAGAGIYVVIVTGSSDRVRQGEALANGARAVIEKAAPFATIVAAVERVRARLPVMPSAQRDELLRAYRAAEQDSREYRRRFASMTRREAEVLGQLMMGRQVFEIAKTRHISESTVRTQVKSILAKLQVGSQLTAVGLAHQIGWKPPADPLSADASALARSRANAAHRAS